MSKSWATSLPDFGWFRLEFVLRLVETRHQGSGDFIVCCWIFVGQCIAPTGALARYIDSHIYIYIYIYTRFSLKYVYTFVARHCVYYRVVHVCRGPGAWV